MKPNALHELRHEVCEVIAKVRLFADDHEPDGYPAIKMKEATLLANELVRMTENFLGAVGKLTAFMGRCAEAEANADELATALADARRPYSDEHDTVLVTAERVEAWDRALSQHADAQKWRNGEALNAHKTALRDIRRVAVALKRDTEPHAFSPNTVECIKGSVEKLMAVIDQYTSPEHD